MMSLRTTDIKFYRADDGEWLARVAETEFPTIVFYFTGPERAGVLADAAAFWAKHIEPKRQMREQAVLNRAEGRRKAAEARVAKAEPA